MAEQEQTFLFNDYFYDPEDTGLEIEIEADGKSIPFRIKRVLTLKEKQRASNDAVKIDFDEKGIPSVSRVDQATYTERIVLAGLKWWPYTYANKKPVPINEKTIQAHDSRLNEKIAEKLLKLEGVQKAALDPFVKKSDEALSPEEQQDQS